MYALCLLACLSPHAAPPTVPQTDFNLRDHAGKTHRLSDFRKLDAVVVVFVSVDCPLATLYAPRLEELSRRYGGKAAFVAVAPNRQDSPADLARYARQHSLLFPVLKDTGHVVADRYGARRSPEAFVLDRSRRIVYRGRIDDQYAVGVQKPRATKTELRDAIDAVLGGRAVPVPVTAAPGCPLERDDREVIAATVTYARDVAPIVQRRCQVCHRPGQSGPFSLLTYKDAAAWAGAVREVVEDRRMPPWGADPRHGKFANDPSLTQSERKTLFAWIDAGCPEGDRRDLPPPRKFSEGWSIKPDVVLTMPEPFTVPAEGAIEYQYFRVDPGFTEDRWIRAAEIRPGNPAVVHHCNVFLQPPGVDDPEELRETGQLGSYCLTMTAPGTPPMVMPDGTAKRIPAGWRIVFVMHYQSVGSVQTDQTQLALTFADAAGVRQEVATKLMYEKSIRIPPREKQYVVTQTWQARRDVLLLSYFPHAHLRARSFRYEVIHPDGREEILLDVPRYDFNWQHRYVLAEPVRVGKGGHIRVTATYDNSTDNPANPDPDAEVLTGTQSWEEMFNGYFDVVLADEDLTVPLPWWERTWRALAWACRPGVALLACVVSGLYLGRRRIAKALSTSKQMGHG
jgi:peroxiredoxin